SFQFGPSVDREVTHCESEFFRADLCSGEFLLLARMLWVGNEGDTLGAGHSFFQQLHPLAYKRKGKQADPGSIAARMREAIGDLCLDWVGADAEYGWDF